MKKLILLAVMCLVYHTLFADETTPTPKSDAHLYGHVIDSKTGELLEKSLPADVESEIQKIILSFPGVSSPHHLRTRRIGSYYAIEVHVRMDGNITLEEAHRTATAIESTLKEHFGKGTHVGIHVEPVKKIIHNS